MLKHGTHGITYQGYPCFWVRHPNGGTITSVTLTEGELKALGPYDCNSIFLKDDHKYACKILGVKTKYFCIKVPNAN